jgi:hypothetical protein
MKNTVIYLLQMMQRKQTMLHVSELRFPLVKPCFVALLRLFEGSEASSGKDDESRAIRSAVVR